MPGVVGNDGLYPGAVGPADKSAYCSPDMPADYYDDAVDVAAAPERSDVLVDDRSVIY